MEAPARGACQNSRRCYSIRCGSNGVAQLFTQLQVEVSYYQYVWKGKIKVWEVLEYRWAQKIDLVDGSHTSVSESVADTFRIARYVFATKKMTVVTL